MLVKADGQTQIRVWLCNRRPWLAYLPTSQIELLWTKHNYIALTRS